MVIFFVMQGKINSTLEKQPNHIIVATAPYSVIVVTEYNVSTRITSYSGLAIDILNHVTAKYGITYEIKLEKNHTFGVKLDNGSWNGMIGMVSRGEADMAANDFGMTYDRAKVVDFSAPFSSDELTLVLQTPQMKPVSIFHPINSNVYFSCLATIVIVACSMHLTMVWQKVLVPCNMADQKTLLDCLVYTIGIQFAQGK